MPAASPRTLVGVRRLLDLAVERIDGVERPGQVAMAEAVARVVEDGRHLLVQAGTGTGKSLGYLVPAIRHAVDSDEPVVVSTATLALQAQLVERDLPLLADALEPALGRRPTYERVMGRANYLCRHKLAGGFPDDEPAGLFEPAGPTSAVGKEVVRLREWAERTATGERADLVPGVGDRAWRQVSVTAHECLGTQRCPEASACFAELSRARARTVDVVVTNHAFLAIDAFEGRAMLPEHDLVVVDEGHELADRVTSVITDELTVGLVEAAARRAARAGAEPDDLQEAAAQLADSLAAAPVGRLAEAPPEALAAALTGVRDTARALVSGLKDGEGSEGARQVARAAVGEVFDVCERLIAGRPLDVVWISESERRGRVLHVAPMSVAELLGERLFSERSVVVTSATLALGGSFDAVAATLGLTGRTGASWSGVDVGSPFDYQRQAILYVARHLPPPTRDGLAAPQLDELEALVRAAGGATLGLFSSRRAAEVAAAAMRERLDVPVLCQGDDLTGRLVRSFAEDTPTCLFGTLSLWQGVDVPGEACRLVVVDRIPFPRPDDPLMSARQRAVEAAGGNAFMTVAAAHAALLLAQGVGRLVRRSEDRGVVAVLDPRLVTARYGPYLVASLPPMWRTTSRDTVFAALRRLAGAEPA